MRTHTLHRQARCGLAFALLALPAAMAAAARPAAEPMIEITVSERDTLTSLSTLRFASPGAWREVARINRLPDPNRIYPGQVLRVPARLMRSRPAPAKLVSVAGDVRLSGAAAAVGTSIGEGDRVETAPDASAVVELADGSRMRLAPSSLAELSASRTYAPPTTDTSAGDDHWFSGTMRMLRGSVEVFATKVLRAKPLEVTTPTAVAGVRGTHYRVDYDDANNQASRSEVLDGAVRFEPADRSSGVELHAGFGSAVDAAAAPPDVIPLPGAPDLSPLPGRFERPLVRFTLPAETSPLRLQIAEDAGFDRIVRDLDVAPNGEARIAGLDDGQWYLRARRVGAKGIEGIDAERPFVLKARPEPPVPSRPRADGKASAGDVEFAWAANAQAPQARLQVAEDEQFTKLLADVDPAGGASQKVAIGTPGTYHWRVASIRADGDHGPFGDPLAFEVRPKPEAPTGGLGDDGKSLVFHLGGRPQDHPLVQLARDVDFKDVVAEQELTSPEWVLPVPAEGGRYYFRYRVKEPDGFIGDYSPPLIVDVPVDRSYFFILLPLVLLL